MKTTYFKILFVCVALILAACTNLDGEFSGDLKVYSSFIVKTDNGKISFSPKTYSINLDIDSGIIGVRKPQIILKTPKGDLPITLPSNAFSPLVKTINASAKDINQDFSIAGKVVSTPIATKGTTKESRMCLYCGECDSNGEAPDPIQKLTSPANYPYRCTCRGTQPYLLTKNLMQEYYLLDFLNNKNVKVATFVAKGKTYIKDYAGKDIGKCE